MEKVTSDESCSGRGTPRLIHSKFNDAEASGIINLLSEQEKLLQHRGRLVSPRDKPQKLPPLQAHVLLKPMKTKTCKHTDRECDGRLKRDRPHPRTPSYLPSQDDVIDLLTSPQLARRYKRPRAANSHTSQLANESIVRSLSVLKERPLTPIPIKDTLEDADENCPDEDNRVPAETMKSNGTDSV